MLQIARSCCTRGVHVALYLNLVKFPLRFDARRRVENISARGLCRYKVPLYHLKHRNSVLILISRRGIKRLSTEQTPSNLYDVLGITSRATHKEIKTAYYQLSMTYHPDKNKNSEVAAQKFREINQAYEILGNFANRRKYDRGIATTDTSGGAAHRRQNTESKVQGESFYRSRVFRSHAPPPSGRTPIYNFDEWTENHYKEILNRTRMNRQFKEKLNIDEDSRRKQWRNEVGTLVIISMLIILSATYMQKNTWLENTPKYNDRKE